MERRPPGDRWSPISGDTDKIFESLTDALEYWYQQTGETNFYLSAREGVVQVVTTEEIEVQPTIKSYSLYGEE